MLSFKVVARFFVAVFAEEASDDAINEQKPVQDRPPVMKGDDSKEHVNIVFIGHVGMYIKETILV